MRIVAARIDAHTAAVGLGFAAATAAPGANATAADSAGARVLARAAVFGIRGEIAAAVDGAAICHTDWAVRALAHAAPAFDGNESTLADLAARPTVVQIGQQIDAGAGVWAVSQPCLTRRGVGLRACGSPWAAARNGHRGRCGRSSCYGASAANGRSP